VLAQIVRAYPARAQLVRVQASSQPVQAKFVRVESGLAKSVLA
jgi:capsid portal protein